MERAWVAVVRGRVMGTMDVVGNVKVRLNNSAMKKLYVYGDFEGPTKLAN